MFFKDPSPSVRSGRIYLSLRLTVPDVGEMVIRRPVFFAVKITIKAPSTLYILENFENVAVISLRKRFKCFLFTIHQRNMKKQQSMAVEKLEKILDS